MFRIVIKCISVKFVNCAPHENCPMIVFLDETPGWLVWSFGQFTFLACEAVQIR